MYVDGFGFFPQIPRVILNLKLQKTFSGLYDTTYNFCLS